MSSTTNADSAAQEVRFVMRALCTALGWDIETDNEGNYVIYPGISDPEWESDNAEGGE